MEWRARDILRVAAQLPLWGEVEDLLHARRDEQFAGPDVQIPLALIRRVDYTGIAFFGHPQRLVRAREFRRSLRDHPFELVMGAMERPLGPPANPDLVGQPLVLRGKLPEHVVDGLRQSVELGRPTARGEAARKVACDDRRRCATDLLYLRKQCAMNQPADARAKREDDDHGPGNSVPEELHQRLEPDAVATDQKVVA